MAKKKEFSDELREHLVHVDSEGKYYEAILKQYDFPLATVQRIINRHKKFNTVKSFSGRGRKRKLSLKLGRKIY